MPVNRTAVVISAIAALTMLLVVALVQLPAILHGPTAESQPVPAPAARSAAAENGVSLDPDVCGSQHTADISVVEQRCKMVCPPGSVYADYHPNQVCTYLWTHAGNALTLIYPEGLQATLDVRR